MRSVGGATPKVEVEIRRYDDGPDCDVVVTARGRRLVMNCPNYDDALRWALLECKVYKLPPIVNQGETAAPPRAFAAWRSISTLQKVG
jgi:hypothetical protein